MAACGYAFSFMCFVDGVQVLNIQVKWLNLDNVHECLNDIQKIVEDSPGWIG